MHRSPFLGSRYPAAFSDFDHCLRLRLPPPPRHCGLFFISFFPSSLVFTLTGRRLLGSGGIFFCRGKLSEWFSAGGRQLLFCVWGAIIGIMEARLRACSFIYHCFLYDQGGFGTIIYSGFWFFFVFFYISFQSLPTTHRTVFNLPTRTTKTPSTSGGKHALLLGMLLGLFMHSSVPRKKQWRLWLEPNN